MVWVVMGGPFGVVRWWGRGRVWRPGRVEGAGVAVGSRSWLWPVRGRRVRSARSWCGRDPARRGCAGARVSPVGRVLCVRVRRKVAGRRVWDAGSAGWIGTVPVGEASQCAKGGVRYPGSARSTGRDRTGRRPVTATWPVARRDAARAGAVDGATPAAAADMRTSRRTTVHEGPPRALGTIAKPIPTKPIPTAPGTTDWICTCHRTPAVPGADMPMCRTSKPSRPDGEDTFPRR